MIENYPPQRETKSKPPLCFMCKCLSSLFGTSDFFPKEEFFSKLRENVRESSYPNNPHFWAAHRALNCLFLFRVRENQRKLLMEEAHTYLSQMLLLNSLQCFWTLVLTFLNPTTESPLWLISFLQNILLVFARLCFWYESQGFPSLLFWERYKYSLSKAGLPKPPDVPN